MPTTKLAMDDISCRILVLSSSIVKGNILVQKLKHLSSLDAMNIKGKDSVDQQQETQRNIVEPVSHPWTISNKYYKADVHFSLHSLSRAYPAMFEGVPAVIVAWTVEEPIEEFMKDLQKAMGGIEPEILLGVRLSEKAQRENLKTHREGADDGDIDSMLMAYGFEYIDASRPLDPRSKSQHHETDDGVPNLPRVLDALSTFMWPSMTTNTDFTSNSSSKTANPDPRSVLRNQSTLEHIINRDPLEILQVLEELDSEFNFGDLGTDEDEDEYHSTLKELIALESESPLAPPNLPKFNFDDPSFPSITGATFSSSITASDVLISSPTDYDFDSSNDFSKPFGIGSDSGTGKVVKPKVSLRFEDDFSAFVTAPEETARTSSLEQGLGQLDLQSGRSTPDYERLYSADAATPPHGGSLYHSLGSMSDLEDTSDAEA